MQDVIEKDDRNYKSKHGKTDKENFFFLRKIHKGHLPIKGADNKQIDFANELKHFDNDTKTVDKRSFLNNLRQLFGPREKVLKNFKSRLFPTKNVDKIPTRQAATEPEIETEPTKATYVHERNINE